MAGAGLSFDTYSVDDPNGSTSQSSDISPFHLFYFSKINRDSRWYAEFYKTDFKLAAGVNTIGQKVETSALVLGYQQRFVFTKWLKPWAGFGVVTAKDTITARHTIDSDGYLDQTYSDRAITSFSAVVNGTIELELNKKFNFGLRGQYLHSFDNSIQGFSAGAMLLYKF
ncbi:MAG: hypothetical protein OQK73_00120 [Gammaproteobacteria bacterium]|nr:hypothetical protein [Gammaproteobacteria bacterium]